MPDMQERSLNVDGVSTGVLTAGEGPRIVLLLHGGVPGVTPYVGGTHHWLPVVGLFARDARVVAIDLLGSGRTAYPGDAPLRADDLVAHVKKTVVQLGIGPCHVVGHDIGGLIAIALAMQMPERVRSISVVASPYSSPIGDAVEDLTFVNPPEPVLGREGQRWAVRRVSAGDRHIDDAFLDAATAAAGQAGVLKAAQAMAAPQARNGFLSSAARLRGQMWTLVRGTGIPVPVQLVWGAQDPRTSWMHAHTMLRHIGRTQIVSQYHLVNDAGSLVFREQPARFHRIVNAFQEGVETIALRGQPAA